MTAQLHHELSALVAETCCLYKVVISQQEINDMEKYIYEKEDRGTEEDLIINLDGESASVKPWNIRFKIGEFILETIETAQGVIGARENFLALSLIAIRYVQKIKGLSRIPISKREAAVLIELYRLFNENDPITIDGLFTLLGNVYSKDEILTALAVLRNLGCVNYGDDGIKLIEPISVINA